MENKNNKIQKIKNYLKHFPLLITQNKEVTKMSWYDKLFLTLAAIGAINWGLTALKFNLVEKIFGLGSTLTNVVYYIVALCGIYAIIKAYSK